MTADVLQSNNEVVPSTSTGSTSFTIPSSSSTDPVNGLSRFRKRLGTEMNEILPHLYLGSLRDATDVEQLEKYKIKHVVAVYELSVNHPIFKERGIDVLKIPVADCASSQIHKHFPETNSYIHMARIRSENVLVHCLAGVSRSATVVAAYLVTISDITYFNALAHIQSRRPVVNPNFGFRMQLCSFAERGTSKERERLKMEFGLDFDQQWSKDKHSLGYRVHVCSNPMYNHAGLEGYRCPWLGGRKGPRLSTYVVLWKGRENIIGHFGAHDFSDLCVYVPGNSLSDCSTRSLTKGSVGGAGWKHRRQNRSHTTQVFRCDLPSSTVLYSFGDSSAETVGKSISNQKSMGELINNIAFIDD